MSLLLLLHSWIWSEMWVTWSFWKLSRISVVASEQIANWKWFKKIVSKSPKEVKVPLGSSMYNLVTFLVRVHWNNLSLIESSIREFDEHNKWKVVIWLPGSSLVFPSNLGISDRSLAGTGGQAELYQIGSLVNLDRSRNFKASKKGNCGGP